MDEERGTTPACNGPLTPGLWSRLRPFIPPPLRPYDLRHHAPRNASATAAACARQEGRFAGVPEARPLEYGLVPAVDGVATRGRHYAGRYLSAYHLEQAEP